MRCTADEKEENELKTPEGKFPGVTVGKPISFVWHCSYKCLLA